MVGDFYCGRRKRERYKEGCQGEKNPPGRRRCAGGMLKCSHNTETEKRDKRVRTVNEPSRGRRKGGECESHIPRKGDRGTLGNFMAGGIIMSGCLTIAGGSGRRKGHRGVVQECTQNL